MQAQPNKEASTSELEHEKEDVAPSEEEFVPMSHKKNQQNKQAKNAPKAIPNKWNIRGITNGPSSRRLKRLVSSYKVSCFAILEPRVCNDRIQEYHRKLNC